MQSKLTSVRLLLGTEAPAMMPSGVDSSLLTDGCGCGCECECECVCVCMQAAVLLCQSMWGPRWFVPNRFLPAKYDYHRPVVPREVAEGALDSSSGPADVETGDGGMFTD